MKKIQLPAIGGLRKVIGGGSTPSVGTTIAELGAGTITLAQLAALITQVQAQQQNTGGGNIGDGTEAVLVPGPGLSGGGPMLGKVALNLTAPIPWSDESAGADGDPGPPGAPGAKGATGSQGPAGVAIFMAGEDGADGQDAVPGPQGPSGATGATGPQGPAGASAILVMIPEDGAEGDPGPPGAAGAKGATGTTGATGPQGPVMISDDGADGDPGPPGATGPAGPTGPQGPAGTGGGGGSSVMMFPEDGADGDWLPLPGANASALIQQRGAAWSNGTIALLAPANDVPLVIAEDCTIQDLTILTEGGTGSCAIDIWRIGFASFPPTVTNSIISGTSYPTITAGVSLRDTSLSGFSTTTLSKGDTLVFHLRSVSTFTEVTIMLSLKRVGDTSAAGYTDRRAEDAVAGIITSSSSITWAYVGGTSLTASVVSTGSIGGNGWRKNNDGTIDQWGISANGGAGPTAITFPIAFPNACFCVLSQDVNVQGTINQASVSTTGFTSTNGAVGSSTYWRAIGN